MVKQRLLFTGLCLILLMYNPVNLYAQSLASVDRQSSAFVHADDAQPERKSLTAVLSEMEAHYKVNIAYDFEMIHDKFIEEFPDLKQQLDNNLDKVLKPFDMEFRKLEEGFYVIRKDKLAIEKIDTRAAMPGSTGQAVQYLPSLKNSSLFKDQFPAITVTGKVTDENNESLPGVNVLIKGSSTGTVTDVDGNYSINAPNDDDVLVFSSIGYITQEVPVDGRSEINVTMAEDVQSLEEVVVVGLWYAEESECHWIGITGFCCQH